MKKTDKKEPKPEELIFAILIVIVGIAGFIIASDFSKRAKILPRFVTALMVVLGGIQVWNNRGEFAHMKNLNGFVKNKTLLLTILGILVYPLALRFLGFTVASVLFMFYLMYIRGLRAYLKMAILSVSVPVVVFLLFSSLAHVHLPTGPWGF